MPTREANQPINSERGICMDRTCGRKTRAAPCTSASHTKAWPELASTPWPSSCQPQHDANTRVGQQQGARAKPTTKADRRKRGRDQTEERTPTRGKHASGSATRSGGASSDGMLGHQNCIQQLAPPVTRPGNRSQPQLANEKQQSDGRGQSMYRCGFVVVRLRDALVAQPAVRQQVRGRACLQSEATAQQLRTRPRRAGERLVGAVNQ